MGIELRYPHIYPRKYWDATGCAGRLLDNNLMKHMRLSMHEKVPGTPGTNDWWRRRESNPRPQVLRREVYMLIPSLISLLATRRAWKTNSQFS
jgi:hypothetical protein